MKKYYKFFLLIFLIILMGCSEPTIQKPLYKYSLIFTGSTGGNIHNCFCRTRRGGILERSYLFKKIIKESENYFIFDCGNSISSDFVSREKLLSIMDYLRYNAYFVSAFEYNSDITFYTTMEDKTKMELSSFTILNNKGEPLFKPYIVKNILGKKVAFLSITGFTRIPDYYSGIHLRKLADAISLLKKIDNQFDYIFIITDYSIMEHELEKNKIDNVMTIFHLNLTRKISDTNWHNGKILSLILNGKFFWHITLGVEKNKFNIIENLIDVKEGIGTDKKLEKMIGN